MSDEKTENYWEGAEHKTGAHLGKKGPKTARAVGRAGAWTLKARGAAKIQVGCAYRAKSEFANLTTCHQTKMPAEHVTICEHGVAVGAKTRKVAIDLAKKSAEWCDQCKARVAAL